jgi:hypothetical protein
VKGLMGSQVRRVQYQKLANAFTKCQQNPEKLNVNIQLKKVFSDGGVNRIFFNDLKRVKRL